MVHRGNRHRQSHATQYGSQNADSTGHRDAEDSFGPGHQHPVEPTVGLVFDHCYDRLVVDDEKSLLPAECFDLAPSSLLKDQQLSYEAFLAGSKNGMQQEQSEIESLLPVLKSGRTPSSTKIICVLVCGMGFLVSRKL